MAQKRDAKSHLEVSAKTRFVRLDVRGTQVPHTGHCGKVATYLNHIFNDEWAKRRAKDAAAAAARWRAFAQTALSKTRPEADNPVFVNDMGADRPTRRPPVRVRST